MLKELDNTLKVHVEDGNIEALDEILKNKNNNIIVLRNIIKYSFDSKKIYLNDFIRYLILYINRPFIACVHIYRNHNENIYHFYEELFKHISTDESGGYIFTIASYEDGINGEHVSLEHLLATIEKFSHPDVKPARNRK